MFTSLFNLQRNNSIDRFIFLIFLITSAVLYSKDRMFSVDNCILLFMSATTPVLTILFEIVIVNKQTPDTFIFLNNIFTAPSINPGVVCDDNILVTAPNCYGCFDAKEKEKKSYHKCILVIIMVIIVTDIIST